MHTISQSAVWIKAPLTDVGVVIVTSAELPEYFIDTLQVAIKDWDQVAYLVVKQSHEFMLDWLRAGSEASESNSSSLCHASQLLRSVSKGCYLLDVEVSPLPSLTWLGSVCGHTLRFVKLGKVELTDAAMDKQVEKILSVARDLAKSVLQERYSA
ncbi:transketolase [Pseudomonas sp. Fig-3]|uniref:transketolase n=1 Tax=unclassified Pseudomonas TaxID=196821 RepID=UPI001112BBCD|nr:MULTISPECIES: transketolase [unclassified Pseudomonas]TNB85917.1 transketolase [Pseudomonas sp. Fig-3]